MVIHLYKHANKQTNKKKWDKLMKELLKELWTKREETVLVYKKTVLVSSILWTWESLQGPGAPMKSCKQQQLNLRKLAPVAFQEWVAAAGIEALPAHKHTLPATPRQPLRSTGHSGAPPAPTSPSNPGTPLLVPLRSLTFPPSADFFIFLLHSFLSLWFLNWWEVFVQK